MIHVRDIMSSAVISVTPETSIRDAMDLLTRHHISGMPVLAAGRVVGVISAADLVAFAASLPAGIVDRYPEPEGSDWDEASPWSEGDPTAWAFLADEWGTHGAPGETADVGTDGARNVLEEHTVADAMTRTPLLTIPPDATVPQAADLMRRAGVHRVLIVDGGRLAGILSALDIARAVADGRLTLRTAASVRRSRSFPNDGTR